MDSKEEENLEILQKAEEDQQEKQRCMECQTKLVILEKRLDNIASILQINPVSSGKTLDQRVEIIEKQIFDLQFNMS